MRSQFALPSQAVASTSSSYALPCAFSSAFRRPSRQHLSLCRPAAATDDAASKFAKEAQDTASRFAQKAQSKFAAFAKDQRLQERAKETLSDASVKARETLDELQGQARRTFIQLDSEYEISSKAAKAARLAQEQARDLDQSWNIRRRIKSAQEYCQRMWPVWQRQFKEFSTTWYGQFAIFFALFTIVTSPIFWRLLLLLWWTAIPLSYLFADVARKRAERLQQEEQERARKANPFADIFRGRSTATGSAATSGFGGFRTQGVQISQQDGPIIEAEWTSIDEGDAGEAKKQRGGRR